ncbi:MAG: ribonuclease E/G [Theionarchaea archaeon]|nr:ribonuclease E/G [Theionarchaea archaeon]
MKDVTVRIRGIYSTALTKILAARGYGICQVSRLIQKRLGIESLDRPPDIDIRHTYNRQGISIVANGMVLDEFLEDMKEDFSDIFVIPSGIDLYGIYKGKNKGRGEIDLGGFSGYLEERTSERELLVQVSEIRNRPILTTRISYSGDYAILIPQEGIKISRKVEDSEERRRLFQLANQLQISPGYGLLWRTAAVRCDQDLLKKEVRRLVEDMHRVNMEFPSTRPGLLREGKKHVNILFGGESKRRMDFIRNNVLPTAHNHHKLKSSGKDVSLAVDVFEHLLEKYSVEEKLDEMLWNLNPWNPGNVVSLEHIQANGEKLHLGRAVIQEFRYPCVSMERRMHTYGVYDGLGAKKEKGDRIITYLKEGEWVFVHSYYSPNGTLKGRYYNICTPVEFYPYKIRYLDLEVDVVEVEGKSKEIIDTEKLERRVEEGHISSKLKEKALEVAQNIIEGNVWIR